MAYCTYQHKYDSKGRVIMYHGTTKKNAREIVCSGFKPSRDGLLGKGVYLSRDIRKAQRYPTNLALSCTHRCIIKVSVDLGKVKRITYKDKGRLQKTWQYNGYDSAWIPPNCGLVASGMEETCVFDPKRVYVISIILYRVVYPKSGGFILCLQ